MDENVVIKLVSRRLKKMGCEIVQQLNTAQRGVDIVARKARTDEDFFVEAKGGTSSRTNSARFGLPYLPQQIFDRVAKGIFTCIQLRTKYPDAARQKVILAVPETPLFRKYLDPVEERLQTFGIEVWFVPNR